MREYEFTPNAIQQGVLQTIQAFKYPPGYAQGSMPEPGYDEIRQSECIEFRLPRGKGSTTLCHYLAYKWKCPIIVRNFDARSEFFDLHRSMFGGEEPVVYTPSHLVEFCSFKNHLSDDSKAFYAAALQSKVIIFDVFRAYCDNSIIKKLIGEMGFCQFIMFQ